MAFRVSAAPRSTARSPSPAILPRSRRPRRIPRGVADFLRLLARRGRPLLLAFVVALVLLAEAMVAVVFSRDWHLSWGTSGTRPAGVPSPSAVGRIGGAAGRVSTADAFSITGDVRGPRPVRAPERHLMMATASFVLPSPFGSTAKSMPWMSATPLLDLAPAADFTAFARHRSIARSAGVDVDDGGAVAATSETGRRGRDLLRTAPRRSSSSSSGRTANAVRRPSKADAEAVGTSSGEEPSDRALRGSLRIHLPRTRPRHTRRRRLLSSCSTRSSRLRRAGRCRVPRTALIENFTGDARVGCSPSSTLLGVHPDHAAFSARWALPSTLAVASSWPARAITLACWALTRANCVFCAAARAAVGLARCDRSP